MSKLHRLVLVLSALIGLLAISAAWADDSLTLNDGTVLHGSVMKTAKGYWIQVPGEKGKTYDASEVKSAQMDDGSSATPSTPAAPSSPGTSGAASGNAGSTSNNPLKTNTFSDIKRRADASLMPMSAVVIWQSWIDNNPASADLAKARDELEKWQKLSDDGAEKINNQWVGGDKRKAILEQAGKLFDDGLELLKEEKSILAVKKFEEAVKIYPNAYEPQSFLGFIAFSTHKYDDALKYFGQCIKLRPDAVDALNNYGVTLYFNKQYISGIDKLKAAAQAEDSPLVAINLVMAIRDLPPATKAQADLKDAKDMATLLASAYHLEGADWDKQGFRLIPPQQAHKNDNGPSLSGMVASGTGFIIQEDGLIVTNRHVVQGGKAFMVMLDSGQHVSADLVTTDKDLDLALLKLKIANKKFPTLSLAKTDNPSEGASCFAVGFPLIDRLGATLKVTQGIISGNNKAPGGVDVLMDIKVNPGNSGGPLLNKYGSVMGIVTMKSVATETEDSYGMAISAGRIRKFLSANKTTPAVGDDADTLDAEGIVAKVKSATVCIISSH